MDAQALAEACRDAVWEHDRATRGLGVQILAVGPGTATLQMMVREDMVNGLGVCHGGYVALLADSCFGYACNAYNETTVASGFDVQLVAAARRGDTLTAVATELARSSRTGLYDVMVHNQRGERVAAFRGRSHTLKGRPLVEGLPMGLSARG